MQQIYFDPAVETAEMHPYLLMQQRQKAEKKELFRAALFVGLCFLAIFILMMLVSSVFGLVMEFFPKLWMYDNGIIGDAIVNILYSAICFGLTAFVFAKLSKVNIAERVSFAPPKKGLGVGTFLLTVGVIPIANYVASMVTSFFNTMGLNPDDGISEAIPSTVPGMVLWLISFSVIPALCEEILCRGYVFGSLRKYGEKTAIFFSAFIFAMLHGNFEQIPFAFILGVVFAYSLSICDSIWIPIAAHFFNNFLSCMLNIVYAVASEDMMNVASIIYLLVLVICGIIGIVIISIKRGDFSTSNKYTGVLSASRRFGTVLSSPTLIIFLGLMLILSVSNMFVPV